MDWYRKPHPNAWNYHAGWQRRVEEHLKDEPLELTRFRNARPDLRAYVGMPSHRDARSSCSGGNRSP
jgi:hypothetical protein